MKCSFCKQESIYYRENEGNHYCRNHFTRSVEKKVKRTIGQNNLIEKNDKIMVALSGGKDSSNILFILKKIFKNNPNIQISAMLVDEGIKGYRDDLIDNAKKFCKNLGVELKIISFEDEFGFSVDQLSKRMKSGYCGVCGLLRRYLLNKKSRELGATKLVTGHNLDDECQSILMNTLKGDLLRLSRMGPMPMINSHPNFTLRIKPLIMVPERESALYAMINNIYYSNQGCSYSSDNALRGESREFLNRLEESSPGIKYSLLESIEKISPFVRTKFNGDRIKNCKECGEPTSQEVCKVCETIKELK